uniref:tRNA N(3)-methylcytidine methyltransferase n=1 Tax=Steinernema glaseri TaxID=37863 RepID=A0A1I8A867_9BILA
MGQQDTPAFGTRYLVDKEKIYDYNAWDHVEWSEEHIEKAMLKIEEQKQHPVWNAEELLRCPAEQWDKFYNKNERKFFMDRHWLLKEFPELNFAENREINGNLPIKILEVGCGVGNTTFPLLECCRNDKAFVYSCDYSATAVRLVQENELYSEENCHAFVWDITKSTDEIPEESLDFIMCIYVLSAVEPQKQKQAINNLVRLLKPGGTLLFKDYGRFDLTQLRFKKDRYIGENFYCRGDGTLVYFYTQDELHELFTSAGLEKLENSQDRRMIVNRAKKIEMYRMWLKCKYMKPLS